eukprot:CAMPEP_0177393984 /NCGR_PEP_ID=MMETSP0368-20130122/55272_1 /TAXON_ID=447022 ORGANISM="Scrippsiella hangoei-like, Strain SHHI-4" /NCGR_SAMPLE_ID=MMETSP0368 /ASSEMBLY_ACC=CAM_ASM_000363 /LENGTH=545 /DNA_ID=CAMNT_0018860263 /DNA_START=32 /DNA_END=1667 /DNA_ORIENTATION=+
MALLPDAFVPSRSMGTVGSWPQLVVRWGRGTVLTPTSATASASAAAAAATSAARAVWPTTAVVGAVLLCAGWARTAERRAGGRRRQLHVATASAFAPRVARRAFPLGDGAKMRLFLEQEKVDRQVQMLGASNDDLETKLSGAQASLKRAQNDLEMKKFQLAILRAKLTEESDERGKLWQQSQTLATSIDQLTSKWLVTENMLERAQKDLIEQTAKLEQEMQFRTELQLEAKSKDFLLSATSARLAEESKERDKFDQQAQQLAAANDDLTTKLICAQQTLDRAQKDLELETAKLQQEAHLRTVLQQEVWSSDSMLSVTSVKLAEETKEREKLQQQAQELAACKDDLAMKLHATEKVLERTQKDLESESAKLEKELQFRAHLEHQVSGLNDQKSTLDAKLIFAEGQKLELKKAFDAVQHEKASVEAELSTVKASSKHKEGQLLAQLGEAEQRQTRLEEQLASAETEQAQAEKNMLDLINSHAEVEAQLKAQAELEERLKEALSSRTDVSASLKKQLQDLLQATQGLEAKMTEAESHSADLLKKLGSS